MSNTKQLTKEDKDLLTKLQAAYDDKVHQLGQVEAQIASSTKHKNVILKELDEMYENEKSTADKLKDKYGEGTIDISTGIFTPSE